MSSANSKVSVTVSENGPYFVTGDVPLAKQTIRADAEGGSEAWLEGDSLPHRATYALCRCGASGTKPFCDGTHLRIGFAGTETASREAYLDALKDRFEQFGRPGQILQRQIEKQILVRSACLHPPLDRSIVRGAILDGVIEDRWIGREPGHRKFVDVVLQRSALRSRVILSSQMLWPRSWSFAVPFVTPRPGMAPLRWSFIRKPILMANLSCARLVERGPDGPRDAAVRPR
jgi:CDGSH-type Zn-finger protein